MYDELGFLNFKAVVFYLFIFFLMMLPYAGTAVVTDTKAALWTDGRYYLQAEKQLDSSWILMKDGLYMFFELLVVKVIREAQYQTNSTGHGKTFGYNPFIQYSKVHEFSLNFGYFIAMILFFLRERGVTIVVLGHGAPDCSS